MTTKYLIYVKWTFKGTLLIDKINYTQKCNKLIDMYSFRYEQLIGSKCKCIKFSKISCNFSYSHNFRLKFGNKESHHELSSNVCIYIYISYEGVSLHILNFN